MIPLPINHQSTISAEGGSACGGNHHPSSISKPRTFIVPGNAAGTRLDIWLTRQALACQAIADQTIACQAIADQTIVWSRARIQALIHDGHVTVNDRMIKEHHKLRPGDSVKLVIPPPVATALIPEAIPLDILYEDCLLYTSDAADE